MARRILWFGTKVGILGGTIYYTNEIGIWKDSEHSTKVLEDATNFVKPYLSENVPVKTSSLPSMAEISSATKTYWNRGVFNTSLFLAGLPSKVVDWSYSGVQFVSQQLNQQVEGKKEEN